MCMPTHGLIIKWILIRSYGAEVALTVILNYGVIRRLKVTHSCGAEAHLKPIHSYGEEVLLKPILNYGAEARLRLTHNCGEEAHLKATR